MLAFWLPGLSLWRNRRPKLGILFLLLQPTLIGWLIGIVVARRNVRRQRSRRWMRINKFDQNKK
jgi:hypothetical protein